METKQLKRNIEVMTSGVTSPSAEKLNEAEEKATLMAIAELIEKYDDLLSSFSDYVHNDLEAADSDYVREALEQAGVSEDAIRAMGLIDLFAEK